MPTIERRAAPLTRETILRAALALVDAEGLEAVSMRRVGMSLGVEAMSLYNHVPSKAAVLDGIFEMVLAELPLPKRRGTWKATLRERARALRGVLMAHPNALPLFSARPAVTPASLAHVELVLASLRAAGVSAERALGAFQILSAFVIGHTAAAHSPVRAEDASRARYEDLSADAFPRVREAAALLPTHDVAREFEFGLEVFLSGLELQLSPR